MNGAGSSYQGQIQDAIEARCRELGYNVLLVFGRALEEPHACSRAHNAIFDLVGPEIVDGVLLISSCLAGFTGVAGIERLVGRFGSLPVCSIGLAVPGVPSVVSNNRTGMEALVEHVIREHGCRRVVFVAGRPDHPESQVRLEVFLNVLARHGLPFDPARAISGEFWKDAARVAFDELLVQGVEFDGVVAANDAMAAGVIETLRKHGRRVPRDVPVTGYDDLQFASLGNPPLTTVRQPLKAMANLAMQIVLDQIAGHSVPLITELPTELVVRCSCGCNLQREPARTSNGPGCVSASEYVRQRAQHLRRVLSCHFGIGSRDGISDANRLLDALSRELEGHAESFVRAVEDLVEEAVGDDERGRAVQLALICLRQELSEVTTVELERLWNVAITAVTLGSTTSQAHYFLSTDDSYFKLLQSGERTSRALDMGSLEDALATDLPALGIQTAFLSRYVPGAAHQLESFLFLRDGVRLAPPESRFPARQLFPAEAYPADHRHTSLVYPLAFEGQSLGVAVIERSGAAGALTYKSIHDQTSAALRNIELHQEIVQKTMLHERSVQERAATAKRMQSLTLLAGGVAHDLNNALGPLVALPDVILAELAQVVLSQDAAQDLRADVESIRAASVRAAQIIKDLLTLGRQGNVTKESIDLNRVVRMCLDTGALRAWRTERREIAPVVDLAPEPLIIRGSEAHLVRAITNLVRNGVESMLGRGPIAIRTSRVRLTEPLCSYETIEPGDYAQVSVTDRGTGIPAADLGRVFEPFFSKKRVGEQSGTGLGLAIVQGVAKEHDGYVDVASTVGQGTTFTLYFPLAEAPLGVCRSAPPVQPGNAKILLVDDEPAQLRTGRRVLSQLGYRVDALESGAKACEFFAQAAAAGRSPYDLVIVDMLLNEDQDGLQVFERIRWLFPKQRGIVVSGHAPTERVESALRSGLTWLAKPYTARGLAISVQAVLALAVGGTQSC